MSSKRDEIIAIIDGAVLPKRTREWSAELADRIIACIAEPTEEMVDATAKYLAIRYSIVPWKECRPEWIKGWKKEARAALVAAGRAMGGNNGKVG